MSCVARLCRGTLGDSGVDSPRQASVRPSPRRRRDVSSGLHEYGACASLRELRGLNLDRSGRVQDGLQEALPGKHDFARRARHASCHRLYGNSGAGDAPAPCTSKTIASRSASSCSSGAVSATCAPRPWKRATGTASARPKPNGPGGSANGGVAQDPGRRAAGRRSRDERKADRGFVARGGRAARIASGWQGLSRLNRGASEPPPRPSRRRPEARPP